MKKVLVTGASGFIGQNVTTALVKRGYKVRAQYRRSNPPDALVAASRLGAELVRGDLRQAGFVERALGDADSVIHVAAYVSMVGAWSKFYDANVAATRHLLAAARAGNCKKFVHISSMAVHGFGNHLDSNENGPYYSLISKYQRSKRQAENLVSSGKLSELPWTIIRPGLVYGPGDTTTLKPVFDLLRKQQLPSLGGFEVFNCPVYIDDLVESILLALESGKSAGEIFDISSGEKVLLSEAVAFAAELLDTPGPSRNIPVWIAYLGGAILELLYSLPVLRGEPTISRYLAAELGTNFHFETKKAESILGYRPKIPWKAGIKAAVDGYLND